MAEKVSSLKEIKKSLTEPHAPMTGTKSWDFSFVNLFTHLIIKYNKRGNTMLSP